MDDLEDNSLAGDSGTVYPDTAIGTLTRQRDQLLAAADQDEGMATIFADKAKAGRDRAAQLQVAIDAMPLDPS